MKSCKIYRTDKEYIFVTQCMTDIGIIMDYDPIYVLPSSIDEQTLLFTIFECLNASKSNIPRPPLEELKSLHKANLNKMGFSSYVTIYKKTKSCRIEIVGDTYKISPYGFFEEGNPGKGLKLLSKQSIVVKNKEALVWAIKECTC